MLAFLLLASIAQAQLEVGDNLKMNLAGGVSLGYGSSLGASPAGHSLGLGGNGALNGYYYNPAFVNFSVNPYLNRDQSNSTYATVDTNSGVTANVNFFSGSHFPGNFRFSRENNSVGIFGAPGELGWLTHGSGQGWAIGWSALLPDLPSLSASFGKSGGASEVDGTNSTSSSESRTLTLASSYRIAGFRMNGTYTNTAVSLNPFNLLGEDNRSHSDNNSVAFGTGHRLPLSGSFMFNYNRTWTGADSVGSSSDTTQNSYSASASLTPFSRMAFTLGTNYTDNLNALMNQRFLADGGRAVFNFGSQSNSLQVYSSAGLRVVRGVSVAATASRVVQHWGGMAHTSEQFSGTASYSTAHRFLGSITVQGGVIDSATKYGNGGAGLTGGVNFSRRIKAWQIGGTFGYSQQVQTIADVLTTSSYRYGGNVRRRFGSYSWTANFNGAHSGIQIGERSSHSESITSALSTRLYSVSGNYGRSSGMSVITVAGMVPLPTSVPTDLIAPTELMLYNSNFFGLGGSVTPMRKMTVNLNFSASNNSTLAGLKSTWGNTSVFTARFRYAFRKMNFNGAFSRYGQSVGALGTTETVVKSYSFGISRWFNVF